MKACEGNSLVICNCGAEISPELVQFGGIAFAQWYCRDCDIKMMQILGEVNFYRATLGKDARALFGPGLEGVGI
jgi:hypothetical protein